MKFISAFVVPAQLLLQPHTSVLPPKAQRLTETIEDLNLFISCFACSLQKCLTVSFISSGIGETPETVVYQTKRYGRVWSQNWEGGDESQILFPKI